MGDGAAPGVLRGLDAGGEVVVEEEVREVGTALVRAHDRVEEARADDAAGLPDARHLAHVDVPLPLRRSRLNQRHPLRVRTNFRCVERVVNVADELLAIGWSPGFSRASTG